MADIVPLVKALIGGDSTAFNPLYDLLLESGDPRVKDLNEWLYSLLPENMIPVMHFGKNNPIFSRICSMFAKELAEADGISPQKIIDDAIEAQKNLSKTFPVPGSNPIIPLENVQWGTYPPQEYRDGSPIDPNFGWGVQFPSITVPRESGIVWTTRTENNTGG